MFSFVFLKWEIDNINSFLNRNVNEGTQVFEITKYLVLYKEMVFGWSYFATVLTLASNKSTM